MRLKNVTSLISLSLLFNAPPAVSQFGGIGDTMADLIKFQNERIPSTVPSYHPSLNPSARPSVIPTLKPSHTPSTSPSSPPTLLPSSRPSSTPSLRPSLRPSSRPSAFPSVDPTSSPSRVPSISPSNIPTFTPSTLPSIIPTTTPTSVPSLVPSLIPSSIPSPTPSSVPSSNSSSNPSSNPLLPTAKSVGDGNGNGGDALPVYKAPKKTTFVLIASIAGALVVGGVFFMAVKYKIKKKQHDHNFEPSSFLADRSSKNSRTSQSENTPVWNRRIQGNGNDFGSKQGLEGIDVHSTEGLDCHEPSVFNGSTIKSEGSWIQRTLTIDIHSHADSAAATLKADIAKTVPVEILVNESKDSNHSPR